MANQAVADVGFKEPTTPLTQEELVPFVNAVRAIMRTWTKEQREERGVIVIVAENGGNCAITSSPGVNVSAVLAAALVSHIKPDVSGHIHPDGHVDVETPEEADEVDANAFERPGDLEN